MSALGGGDPKTDAMIERRRALDKERLQRIKDPKTRTMGIDTDALAAQVAEKQAAKTSEKLRDLAYDNERLLLDQQLAYLEQERLRAERVKNADVAEYIKTYQGREKSREYDLSDPLALKKDEPARTGDDDPKVSVSGLQRFLGEDLSYAHRVKMQQQEQAAWNAEQIATKASMKGNAGDLDKTYAERAMEIDSIKTQLEATAAAARKAQNVAVAEYQLAQAAAKRERERADQIANLQDSVEEIQNNLAGDLLTENPEVGRSYIAPNRLRPDHYKGMPPEQQQAILLEQQAQRTAKLEAKAMTKAEDAQLDAYAESLRKMACYTEAEIQASRAEMRTRVMEENLGLAASQSASKAFLKTQVYTNAVDPSFFDQFGQTSR